MTSFVVQYYDITEQCWLYTSTENANINTCATGNRAYIFTPRYRHIVLTAIPSHEMFILSFVSTSDPNCISNE